MTVLSCPRRDSSLPTQRTGGESQPSAALPCLAQRPSLQTGPGDATGAAGDGGTALASGSAGLRWKPREGHMAAGQETRLRQARVRRGVWEPLRTATHPQETEEDSGSCRAREPSVGEGGTRGDETAAGGARTRTVTARLHGGRRSRGQRGCSPRGDSAVSLPRGHRGTEGGRARRFQRGRRAGAQDGRSARGHLTPGPEAAPGHRSSAGPRKGSAGGRPPSPWVGG